MRIALVISSLNSGGAERVISELANYWIKSGHEISFFTFSKLDSKPFYKLDSKVVVQNLEQNNETKKNFFKKFFHLYKRVLILRISLKSYNPDIIISFIDIMNIITILASFNFRVPIIVSERIDPKYHKIPLFYNCLRIILYSQVKYLVVQTISASNYFPRYLKKLIRIIPNPVKNINYSKSDVTLPVRHLISVGRLDIQKDHKTLILAFSDLIFVHEKDLFLTIYGEGPERKNLEKLIVSLGLQDRVFLPGVISDIYHQISLADIFIFPSLYEGFPNALCEAMAIGTPVIASQCSGNTDVLRNEIDGLFFPIKDVPSLVSKIILLIESSSKRELYTKNAITILERFNPEYIFNFWDQLINIKITHSP